jgi:hypothetical protein
LTPRRFTAKSTTRCEAFSSDTSSFVAVAQGVVAGIGFFAVDRYARRYLDVVSENRDRVGGTDARRRERNDRQD